MRSPFQLEDVLLLGWLLLEPAVEDQVTAVLGSPSFDTLEAGTPGAVQAGWTLLVAMTLLVLTALTHPREIEPATDNTIPVTGRPAFFARCVLVATQLICLDTALDLLGWSGAGAISSIGAVLIVLSLVLWPWLPRVPGLVRRVAAFPAAWAGTHMFAAIAGNQFEETFGDGLGGLLESARTQGLEDYAWFVLGMLAASTMAVYTMFIYAPRALAGAGGAWWVWGLRFGLYAAGVILNVGILGGP